MKKFILGILFGMILIPIIETITEIGLTILEIPKGKTSIKVINLSKKLQEAQMEIEPVNTVAMGFQMSSDDEYYDEDEI